jgi:hypothetical protein
MHYCAKWPKACTVLKQEASTVEEAVLTNSFCPFGVPREIHIDQGINL